MKLIMQDFKIKKEYTNKVVNACELENIEITLLSMENVDTFISSNEVADNTFIKGSVMFMDKFNKAYPDNITFKLLKHNGSFRNILNVVDSNDLFNADAKVMSREDMKSIKYPAFIRPINDDKSFIAGIYDDFDDKMPTEAVVTTPKLIDSEYRFAIVDGKVIDYSAYRGSSEVPDSVIKNVKAVVSKYTNDFGRAYILDYAVGPDNEGLLELNIYLGASPYNMSLLSMLNALKIIDN